ncbi:MAG: 4Fe-4S binding protein [Bacteroides sp.]|nr:4Fe-4S binding protein [Bacteroides sp.]
MIYFFSGTGNTRIVATQLSLLTLEECRKITDVNPLTEIPEGEGIGFVFPVYSWGVAPVMAKFIDELPETFWEEVKRRQLPVWCVMTCGDEVALAPEMFSKILSRHGIEPESIWSVIMPNNYVLLPGFDVDQKNIEERKLTDAPGRIREIARGIRQHSKTVDVVRGSMPWVKTKLVYPLFCKWGISTKKWHSTAACVGCGICAKACPLRNISMVDRVPVWGINCCSCLACYHSCPRHAVAYGKATQSKGQYFAPEK